MSLFKRRRRQEPKAVIAHLLQVTTQAHLDADDADIDRACQHVAADLDGLDRVTLIKVAALCLLAEGDAQAERIRSFARGAMVDLAAHLAAEGPEMAAERPEPAPEAQDPLPDVSTDETAAEGWREDRR